MTEEAASSEETLARFNRLVRELLRRQINRNTFRPWEVALLLDVEDCHVRESAKEGILRRYQKAVQRQLDKGAETPMKLSEFLKRRS